MVNGYMKLSQAQILLKATSFPEFTLYIEAVKTFDGIMHHKDMEIALEQRILTAGIKVLSVRNIGSKLFSDPSTLQTKFYFSFNLFFGDIAEMNKCQKQLISIGVTCV